MNKKLLTVKEAAATLNCHPKVVYKLARTEGFPALRVGEKLIMIPSGLLQIWIEREAKKPFE